MRLWILIAAVVALAVSALAGAATNTTYHVITVDGSCADWASDEKFATADAGLDVYLTWDAETVYVGWSGESNSQLSRYAAFDLDRGSDNGSDASLGTTSFSEAGQPDFGVDYSFGNNQDFLFFLVRNGDSFDSSPQNPVGTDGAFSATGCGGGPFAEVSIDRELFDVSPPAAAPSLSGLTSDDDMGVYSWIQVNEGLLEGSMPAANMNSSPLQYEAYCPITNGGQAPNQFCAATTRATVTGFAARGRTITWRTASELGVLGFELRRDGRRIAFVRAKGSARGATYRYVDRAVRPGTRHTYRVRVIRS